MRITLTPPVLPAFLAGTYDLKPVEGTPSDEEVRLVHAAIRALNDVVNGSASIIRCGPSYAAFDASVQRPDGDRYPCILSPFVSIVTSLPASIQLLLAFDFRGQNTTHTPPPLPAHIPVELEPVTGPPSDSQIKSVQAALRISESMVNVPSMFDADLSVKLSQHLFDIQFERYLRQIAGENLPAPVKNNSTEGHRELDDRDVSTTETAASGSVKESHEALAQDLVSRSNPAARDTMEQLEPIQPGPKQDLAELLKIGLADTNKLLVNLKQILIATQQSVARGMNRTIHASHVWPCTHTLLNGNGEEPHNLVPHLWHFQYSIAFDKPVQGSDLARCLRFYGLGGEFIEEGAKLTIKEGKTDAARAELKSFFGF